MQKGSWLFAAGMWNCSLFSLKCFDYFPTYFMILLPCGQILLFSPADFANSFRAQKQNQLISFLFTAKQINDICREKLFSRIIAESWDQLCVDFHAIPVYIFTSIKVFFFVSFLQQFINVTWHFAYLRVYICMFVYPLVPSRFCCVH